MAVTTSTGDWTFDLTASEGTSWSTVDSSIFGSTTKVYTTLGTSYYPDPRKKEAQRRIMEALVNDIVHKAYPDADLSR